MQVWELGGGVLELWSLCSIHSVINKRMEFDHCDLTISKHSVYKRKLDPNARPTDTLGREHVCARYMARASASE